MPAPLHQRLLNEATVLATEDILELPTEYSPALEQAILKAVRQAIVYYAAGLDPLNRQLRPLDQAKSGHDRADVSRL